MRTLKVCLAAALLSTPTMMRSQSSTFVVAGRVLNASGSPIGGAEVSAADVDALAAKFARADASGRYRIRVDRGPTMLVVSARFIGYAALIKRVAVAASDTLIVVPDFRLPASTQALPAVHTVAQRAPPSRSTAVNAPGETPNIIDGSSFLTTDLTGDLTGDLSLVLGAIPGITVTPDPNGGPPAFSFAGLGADQNRVTMNGADFGGTPPRDGGVIRISTSNYDVAKAASGASTEWIMLSGAGRQVRQLHMTLDAPPLQWTTPVGDRLGQRTLFPTVSGVVSGWPGGFVQLASVTFQASRRANNLSTLPTEDPQSLGVLQLNPDSVARLLSALTTLGIPAGAVRQGAQRVTTSGGMYTRLDFTRNSVEFSLPNASGRAGHFDGRSGGHVFYIVAGGDWSESEGAPAGATTLPIFSSESHTTSGTIQAINSVYVRNFILNETRSALNVLETRSAPSVSLPGASVLMASIGAGGVPLFSGVDAAGNGSAQTSNRRLSWQTTNVTRWSTEENRHEPKVVVELTLDHVDLNRDPGLGDFGFNSLSDFISSRPSFFARSTSSISNSVSGAHSAIGVGDTYTPSRNFATQYGVRAEAHQFDASDPRNPLVDSLFGARSGRLPSVVAISPMAGFTWALGPKDSTGWANRSRMLVGGIRDYRGLISTSSVEPLTRQNGLSSGAQQFFCDGDAAPAATWSTFLTSPSTIPTRCADGSAGTSFAQATPAVSMMAPGYTVSHSIRADLTYTSTLTDRWTGSLHGMSAITSSLEETYDLNFNGTPSFSVASEGGRPVYVAASDVVPETGAMSTTDSRRFASFAQVSERRSDRRSQFNSITGTLDYHPYVSFVSSGINLPLYVAYTLTDGRSLSNGFSSTTSGDPRTTDWAPGAFSRHAVQLSTFLRNSDWGTLSLGMTARSGMAYTPKVSADINGDGFANDRAFVFDPRTAPDTALANGMSKLLASAPRNAADCLRAQMTSVAAQNSCSGPWTATMNASVILNTARFNLQNRGAVKLVLTNVLAGVDQLLHGENNLHGWGQAAYSDPTLLQVRGFDPAQQRFLYAVNSQFGRSDALWNRYFSPFKLTIDVNVDIGPDRERATMVSRISPLPDDRMGVLDSASIAGKLIGTRLQTLFASILERADTLQLAPWVVDSLKVMQQRHGALRRSLYGALAGFLIARRGQYNDEEVDRRWYSARDSIAWDEFRIISAMHAMIPAEQLQRWVAIVAPAVPYNLTEKIDEAEMRRRLKGWLLVSY